MAQGSVRITVLGSGTSVGVPSILCECPVCRSDDPRDKRLRPSVLVTFQDAQHVERNVLIDSTPDFREQALRARFPTVDAILFTHSHADHIMGLDDVRPFNFKQGGSIPIYGSEETMNNIRAAFRYIFDDRKSESSRPRLAINIFNDDARMDLFGIEFQPVRVNHGKGTVHGFRFRNAAYLTDHSDIPPESLEKLADLDVVFLDALRHKPHPTHSTVEHSLRTVQALMPKRAFFTHISHELSHVGTEAKLPPTVRLAYDGLQIDSPA